MSENSCQLIEYCVMFPMKIEIEVKADSVKAAQAAAGKELDDQLLVLLSATAEAPAVYLSRVGPTCAVSIVQQDVILDLEDRNRRFAEALRQAADDAEDLADDLSKVASGEKNLLGPG